ncbi:MAG: UDP-N-acetylmuramoyl-L-alanine--D-glutamate ligase [Lentisphaeria bacterium]|jgi:UDP-N-acetylmuramoylalanine--D-glutamate ligase
MPPTPNPESAPIRLLILGLGVSGLAAAELGASLGLATAVLDAADSPALGERAERLRERGVSVHLAWGRDQWPGPPPELAVVSPGIPPSSVLGRLAAALPCPVISELEFGFRHLRCPALAITGTNGKTTCTELLTACLAEAGLRAVAAGNIGYPLAEAARRSADLDWAVVEVSSFQLETADRFAPRAAAVLNITPDHLDRYAGMGTYAAAKARILRHLARAEQAILRTELLELPEIRAALPGAGSRPTLFQLAPPSGGPGPAPDYYVAADGWLCRRGERLLHRDALKLKGGHNLENVLAVSALAEQAGVPFAAIRPALERFAPSAHRLELVAVKNGVRYINDSKATNPDALQRALEAVGPETRGRVLLIAGGLDKGLEFSTLRPLLARQVKQVALIGKCREALAQQWRDIVYCKEFSSLAAAVEDAVENAGAGDTVLLSPGCASMDMFVNYADRGNQFRELVKRRLGE